MQTKTTPPKEFHRLTLDQYADLEKAVNVSTFVGADTTPLQAGYQLGIQHVLAKLRSGFVVGA